MSGQVTYPLGESSFAKIRKAGKLYVDKTGFIPDLLKGSYYFLSRPRRFGKSLLISTLEEFFLGNRDLFKGLAVDQLLPELWETYPVLHLDFMSMSYDSDGMLEEKLDTVLSEWENLYGISGVRMSPSNRFDNVIRQAYSATGKRVVILIDEYDKPVLDGIGNKELEEQNRSLLRAFYGAMKANDANIRFVLLTGVGHIGQINVFSGLNNISDITYSDKYASICGITETELTKYFLPSVREWSQHKDIPEDKLLHELKKRYDGYHFAEEGENIYNPFSLMNAFESRRLGSFWYTSGTPSSLMRRIATSRISPEQLADSFITPRQLESLDVVRSDSLTGFLLQTGYLTIKKYDPQLSRFIVGIPNQEVAEGIYQGILPYYIGLSSENGDDTVARSVSELQASLILGRPEAFVNFLIQFFDEAQYDFFDTKRIEKSFRDVIYCISKLMGMNTRIEDHTPRGSIDMMAETDQYVYIFEYKVNKTALVAMSQINERGYALKYLHSGKRIIKIAVNFSTQTRNIDDFLIEEC